jgi:trans-2,3-dihydro-3-hydroxyanthranilate isomerase
MPAIQFYWVDVFADQRFEGNQLAVFPEAGELDGKTMQKIALEMNLSESTFIVGSEVDMEGKISFRTRIFTKEEELPFAGHPTLGTAYVLRDLYGGDEIWLSLKVGKIKVKFEEREDGIFGEMVQKDPSFGSVHKVGTIAKIYGVKSTDLDGSLGIQTVSTGNPFIVVPFKTLKAIQHLNPNIASMNDYLKKSDARFIYAVTRETESKDAILHARMLYGGGEDPATGSAAGPAAAWMLKNGMIEPEKLYSIEQGSEINRPSRIYVRGSKNGGSISNIRVGGKCFIISKGELTL